MGALFCCGARDYRSEEIEDHINFINHEEAVIKLKICKYDSHSKGLDA